MINLLRMKIFALPLLLVGIVLIAGLAALQPTTPALAHGCFITPDPVTITAGESGTATVNLIYHFGEPTASLSTGVTPAGVSVSSYSPNPSATGSSVMSIDTTLAAVSGLVQVIDTDPSNIASCFVNVIIELSPEALKEAAIDEIHALEDFIEFKCTDPVNQTTVIDLRTGQPVFLWMVSPSLCGGYLNQLAAADKGLHKSLQFLEEGKVEEAIGIEQSKEGLLESLLARVLDQRCAVIQGDLPPGPKTVSLRTAPDGRCDLPRASIIIEEELLRIKGKLLLAIELELEEIDNGGP